MCALLGYVRVDRGPDASLEVDALTAAGCDRIFWPHATVSPARVLEHPQQLGTMDARRPQSAGS